MTRYVAFGTAEAKQIVARFAPSSLVGGIELYGPLLLVPLAVIAAVAAFGVRGALDGRGRTPPPLAQAETPAISQANATPASGPDKPAADRFAATSAAGAAASSGQPPAAVETTIASAHDPSADGAAASGGQLPAAAATTIASAHDPSAEGAAASGGQPPAAVETTIATAHDPSTDGAAASLGSPKGAPAETTAAAPNQSPAPVTAVGEVNYVVQVSAHRTPEEAQAYFRVLQARHPTILSSREPIILRKDLGRKGVFWRAELGPFGSRADATQLCRTLKSAGGQCLVRRN